MLEGAERSDKRSGETSPGYQPERLYISGRHPSGQMQTSDRPSAGRNVQDLASLPADVFFGESFPESTATPYTLQGLSWRGIDSVKARSGTSSSMRAHRGPKRTAGVLFALTHPGPLSPPRTRPRSRPSWRQSRSTLQAWIVRLRRKSYRRPRRACRVLLLK